MFEAERWEIVEHYMSMLEQLNTQSQHVSRSHSEIYTKLSDLLRTMRRSPLPPLTNLRPSIITPPSSILSPPSSRIRRRPRGTNNNVEMESVPNVSAHTPPSPTHPQRDTTPPISTREGGIGLSDETTQSIPSVFSTTISNPASSFTNLFQDLHWTRQPLMQRTFNFLDNVPVFPSSEEIARATRVISFGSIEAPNNSQCPITMVPFEPSDNVMQILFCGHIFDIVHLNGWFRDNVRCPMCRHDIRDNAIPDVGAMVDTPSDLAPDVFVEDASDTDSEMPGLELATDNETGIYPHISETASNSAFTATNIDMLVGVRNTDLSENTIRMPPVWDFTHTNLVSNDNDRDPNPVPDPAPAPAPDPVPAPDPNPGLTRVITELQNSLANQGLNMLSTVITQSIRESFPPTEPRSTPPPDTSEDMGRNP